MKSGFSCWVLILAFVLSACGRTLTPEPPIFTAPGIGLQITDQYCPSVEVQLGTHIAWTNVDDVDHMLIIERVDEQGVVLESGGMPLLQPDTTFSILLTEVGQYTYYCSLDRKQFGTIKVLPNMTNGADPSQGSSTVIPGTSECVETLMPALITAIQPLQPSAGGDITVIGDGGYILNSCGAVNESARSFTLYLDQESVGDFMCYINHCELNFLLPDTLTEGPHCLATQKDVCEFQFTVVK